MALEATQKATINKEVSTLGTWAGAASRKFPNLVLPPVTVFDSLAELKGLIAALQRTSHIIDGKPFVLKDRNAVKSLVKCINEIRKRSDFYNKIGMHSEVMLGAFNWNVLSDGDPADPEFVEDGPLFLDNGSDGEDDGSESDLAELLREDPMKSIGSLRFEISDEMIFEFCNVVLSCSMGWQNGPKAIMVDILSVPEGRPKCTLEVDVKIVAKPECTIPSTGVGGFVPESLLCVFLVSSEIKKGRKHSGKGSSLCSLNLEPVRGLGYDRRKNATKVLLSSWATPSEREDALQIPGEGTRLGGNSGIGILIGGSL